MVIAENNSTYIMEDPREAGRLEQKVDLAPWAQEFLHPHMTSNSAVLSVGCGPGVILRSLSEAFPYGTYCGIDISPARIEEAKQRSSGSRNISFVCSDAHRIEYPDSTFDLVYCRLLLQYLRDKKQAVREMVRVCKPDGTVLLYDLDGQLLWHYPEDGSIQETLQKVMSLLEPSGFDPFVGRKLFWLAKTSGLENLDVKVTPYHLIAGRPNDVILQQWKMKLEIAKPHLVRVSGTEKSAENQIQEFLSFLLREDSLTYSTAFSVTGKKP